MSDEELPGAPKPAQEGRPELRPARPDAKSSDAEVGEGRPSYMPRMPWGWILLGTAAVAGLFGVYHVRQRQSAEAIRQQMLALHDERLTEIAERYMSFRERLEGMISEAAQAGEPETWVDPQLKIAGLRSGDGLYVRLPIEAARERESIGPAAWGAQDDSIMRCMGIAPMNLRGLYQNGEFLTPEWLETLRTEQDRMQLRMLDDQLGRHVKVDAPVVASMMQADWLMVVLQQGEDRRDHPVDVFLWDLKRDRQLLRTRVQARGLLVPVRLRFEGVAEGAAPADSNLLSGGATDCSIASQLRSLTGGAPIDFASGEELLRDDVEEDAGNDGEDEAAPAPSSAGPDTHEEEVAAPAP